jgi:hypothetical protein
MLNMRAIAANEAEAKRSGAYPQPPLAARARRGTTRRNRCLRAAERRRIENYAA